MLLTTPKKLIEKQIKLKDEIYFGSDGMREKMPTFRGIKFKFKKYLSHLYSDLSLGSIRT
jgi:hypothetical protein